MTLIQSSAVGCSGRWDGGGGGGGERRAEAATVPVTRLCLLPLTSLGLQWTADLFSVLHKAGRRLWWPLWAVQCSVSLPPWESVSRLGASWTLPPASCSVPVLIHKSIFVWKTTMATSIYILNLSWAYVWSGGYTSRCDHVLPSWLVPKPDFRKDNLQRGVVSPSHLPIITVQSCILSIPAPISLYDHRIEGDILSVNHIMIHQLKD